MIKRRPITKQWHSVESSTIHSWHYGNTTQRLKIRFKDKNGNITSMYIYEKVGRYISHDLQESASIGTYFHANVKDKFETRKVY